MTRSADVLIQAGHEGRTSGATGAAANGLREIDLTPRVADAATAVLREAGLTVLRDPAATSAASVKVAVAFHFDGPPQAGAQFLFDDPTDKPLADFLRVAYDARYDGRWLRDNTSYLADSTGFSRYYGFSHWSTTDGEVVMELDTIGDPVRAAIWSQPGYPEWAGRVVGAAIARRLGKSVADPGPFGEPVTGTPIIGPASASKAQALQLWRDRYSANSKWDAETVERIVSAYFTIGADETVDGAGALAQSLKETGGFSFLTPAGTPPASGYSPTQWNFAGIGTTGAGVPGESWPTPEAGVRGHLRRLRLYAAGTDELHVSEIVKRSLPERLWGSAPTFEQLGGKWAPSPDYGHSIVRHYLEPMRGIVASTGRFDDVPDTHWSYDDVELLARLGIVVGEGDRRFDPDDEVKRAEAAAMIARLYRLLTGGTP